MFKFFLGCVLGPLETLISCCFTIFNKHFVHCQHFLKENSLLDDASVSIIVEAAYGYEELKRYEGWFGEQ